MKIVLVLLAVSVGAGLAENDEPPYRLLKVETKSDPEKKLLRALIVIIRQDTVEKTGFASIIFPAQTGYLNLPRTFVGARCRTPTFQAGSGKITATDVQNCSGLVNRELLLCDIWRNATKHPDFLGPSFKACDVESGMCDQFANETQGDVAGLAALVPPPDPHDTEPFYQTSTEPTYFMVPIYLVSAKPGGSIFNQSLHLTDYKKNELLTSLIKLLNWFSSKAMEIKNTRSDDVTARFKTDYNKITFVLDYHVMELDYKPKSELPPIVASFSYNSACYLHAVNRDTKKSSFIRSCRTNEDKAAQVFSMDELFSNITHCTNLADRTYFEAVTELHDVKKVRYFVDQSTGVKDMTSTDCPTEEPILKQDGYFHELNGGGEMFANYSEQAGGAVAYVPSYEFTYWFKNYFIVPQYHEQGKNLFREYYKKTCCLPTSPVNFRMKVDSIFLKPGTPKPNTTLIFFKGDYYLEYNFSAVLEHPAAWQDFKPKYRPDKWPEAFVPNYRAYEKYKHSFDFPSDVKDYTGKLVDETLKDIQKRCGTCTDGHTIRHYLAKTLYKGYFPGDTKGSVSLPIVIATFPTNKAYLDTRKNITVLQYHLGNLTSNSLARMIGAHFLHDALNVPYEDYQCDCKQEYHPASARHADVHNVNCKYHQDKQGKCGGKVQTNHPCIMHDFSTRRPNPVPNEFAFCNTTMKYLDWLKP